MTTTEVESRIIALEKQVASLQEQLEHARIVADLKRSLSDADRGLGIPLQQADDQIRAKYNIPRS